MRRVLALVAAVAVFAAGSLSAAWAAGLTVSSAHLGGSAVTTPVMFPVSVTIANKGGGHLGKPENGDIITIVFSRPVDEPTMCSGWSNTSSTQSLNLKWSVVPGTPDDLLEPTGTSPTCATGLHVGVIDLGAPGYNAGTTSLDFNTTTNALSVGASTTTLTVTLNGQAKGGTPGTVSSGNAAVFTPDAAIADRSARTCGANLAQTSATVQF